MALEGFCAIMAGTMFRGLALSLVIIGVGISMPTRVG
jgi:hypothetical protein